MGKRKALSKKLRFEIFKRDSFACQYCGAKAPDVLLHVDHIDPVKRGGKNDIMNLITACVACNGGKGAVSLGDASAVVRARKQMEDLEERRAQLRLMLEWKHGLEDIKRQSALGVGGFFSRLCPGFYLSETGVANVEKLLAKYSVDEVVSALTESCGHYLERGKDGKPTQASASLALSKLAGMAWVQKQRRTDPDIDRLFYIRGILRKRPLHGVRDYEFMPALKAMMAAGYSVEQISDVAKTVGDALDFQKWVDAWTKGR